MRTPTTIRLTDEERAALDKAAADDRRPFGALARLIIVDWLRSRGYLPAE